MSHPTYQSTDDGCDHNHDDGVSNKEFDFEKMFSMIGSFGKYQKKLFLLVCLPTIACSYITLSSVFTHYSNEKYRCKIEGCDIKTNAKYDDAFTEDFANFSIMDPCHQRERKDLTNSCDAIDFNLNSSQHCSHYVYEQSVFKSTVVSEFNLVCDREWMVPFTKSFFFFGVLIGAALFGVYADYAGRKSALILSLTMTCISATMLAVSQKLYLVLFFTFLCSIGQVGFFQTAFIYSMEIVSDKHRMFCSTVIEYFFVLGDVLLCLVSFSSRSWRPTILIGMSPWILMVVVHIFILPESMMWLASQKQYTKMKTVVDKFLVENEVGTSNSVDISLFSKPQSRNSTSRQSRESSKMSLENCFYLTLMFISTSFGWFAINMTYYGISLASGDLSSNVFISFLLVSLVEIPGYSLSYTTMSKYGRKCSVAYSLVGGGIFCVISQQFSNSYVQLTFVTLAKLLLTCTFGSIYLFTGELAPTSSRSSTIASCSVVGRVGAIIAPFITDLSSVYRWLPLTIFGGLCLCSGLVIALILPETGDVELPLNLRVAGERVRDQLMFRRSTSIVEEYDGDDDTRPLLDTN